MKTRKTYKWSTYVILPIVIIAIFVFFTQATKYVFYPYMAVNWITLATAVFFIFSPWGSIRLDDDTNPGKKLSVIRWLLTIVLLELSMLLIYIGLYTFCYHLFPVHNGPVSLTQTLITIWQKWVIYPWGAVGMLAISLAFVCYNNKEDAFVSSTIVPLLKNKNDSLTTHNLQFNVRNSIMSGIAVTFGLYLMLIAVLLSHNHPNLIPHGLTTPAFVTALIMAVFAFLPFIKMAERKLLRRGIPTILGICTMLVLGALVLLVFSALFSTITVTQKGYHNPLYYKSLISLGHNGIWLLFTVNWWLIMVPVAATVIGYLSKGYSIRSTLLATMVGPALMSMAPHFHYYIPHTLLLVLIFVGFIIFFGIITTKNIRGMIALGAIPKQGKYKSRDYHFFYRRTFRYAASIPYFYLPIGIMYVALLMYTVGILACIVLVLAAISFIVAIAKRDIAPGD